MTSRNTTINLNKNLINSKLSNKLNNTPDNNNILAKNNHAIFEKSQLKIPKQNYRINKSGKERLNSKFFNLNHDYIQASNPITGYKNNIDF